MKEGWERKKLGDCFSYIKNGANIKQEKDAGGLPITRIETLSGGVFNRDRMGYANIDDNGKYDSFILNNGDLLLSHINSKAYIGRTVLYEKEGSEKIIHGMNLLRLIPIGQLLCSKFFFYHTLCDTFKAYIARIRKDAVNQSSIAISDLKNIPIPVPPLSVQESIVSELDMLSGIISKHKALQEEYDRLEQSIFYDMFGDPVTNEKGWEVKKLGEVTSKLGSGATPKGGNESYKEEGISLIRSLNVHNNLFKYEDLAHIDDEQAAELKNVIVKEEDILLNITGASVARCCIVPDDILPARVNQHVCIVRPIKDYALSIYLNRVLTNQTFQINLIALSKSKAATREALPKNIVENVVIPLPPLSLQQSFADKISAIEQMKAKNKAAQEEAEMLFNERMAYYF